MAETIEIPLDDKQSLNVSWYGPNEFYLSVSYEDYEDETVLVGNLPQEIVVQRDHDFEMDLDQIKELADAIYTVRKRASSSKEY